MHTKTKKHARKGFTLIDLTAIVVGVSATLVVAAPTLQATMKARQSVGSAGNLRLQALATGMYANANKGKIATYSWRGPLGKEQYVQYVLPNGNAKRARDDRDAAMIQDQALLMRMTGRLNGEYQIRATPGRLVHKRFTHLILMDFMGPQLDDEVFVDPADTNMLEWHRNPLDYGPTSSVPYAVDEPSNGYDYDDNWWSLEVRQRWAFSSSYAVVPHAWLSQGSATQYGPINNSMHLMTEIGALSNLQLLHLGNSMSSVAFPSQKVYTHEEYDRRGAIPLHYAYDDARPLKLMFDGSINARASEDARSSIDPGTQELWLQDYIPLDTYPAPFGDNGESWDLNLRYRWTANGLLGFDYTQ